MSFCKRLCALLLTLAAVLVLPLNALAAGRIDLTRDVGLTLSYKEGETPLAGASFRIYLVATMDAYGELTVTETFKGYSVDIRGKNDAAWHHLADTLAGYVLRDNVAPADSGKTDTHGQLVFPTDGGRLTAGLYLVTGQRHTQNGFRYDPAPFMVLLPAQEANEWVYDVHAAPKADISPLPEEGGTVARKVLKVWDDSGEGRPSSVTVQLLRDGKVYDTVTLSAENRWQHRWSELDDVYVWQVVEKTVPEGYTVSVGREGITLVITNTAAAPTVPPPSEPSAPPSPPTPTDDTPRQPTLPQTGQLWWPVPLLALAGLLLTAAGAAVRRRGAEDEA